MVLEHESTLQSTFYKIALYSRKMMTKQFVIRCKPKIKHKYEISSKYLDQSQGRLTRIHKNKNKNLLLPIKGPTRGKQFNTMISLIYIFLFFLTISQHQDKLFNRYSTFCLVSPNVPIIIFSVLT